jgi:hypothetical protein
MLFEDKGFGGFAASDKGYFLAYRYHRSSPDGVPPTPSCPSTTGYHGFEVERGRISAVLARKGRDEGFMQLPAQAF